MKVNKLTPGEYVFLFFWAFPNDVPHIVIAQMTGIDRGTISRWRKYFNAKCGAYLDLYYDNIPFGNDERIVELDAMWFGANKAAPAANNQARFRPKKCIWGLVERHNGRFRCWYVKGENRTE